MLAPPRKLSLERFMADKADVWDGIVQRFEKKNIIVNLGRTDAILLEKEQIPRERYRQGDRIRAFILDVEPGAIDASIWSSSAAVNGAGSAAASVAVTAGTVIRPSLA